VTASTRPGPNRATARRRRVIDPALSETFLTSLSDLNRLVRTRMLGGVGRAVSNDRPYPIRPRLGALPALARALCPLPLGFTPCPPYCSRRPLLSVLATMLTLAPVRVPPAAALRLSHLLSAFTPVERTVPARPWFLDSPLCRLRGSRHAAPKRVGSGEGGNLRTDDSDAWA